MTSCAFLDLVADESSSTDLDPHRPKRCSLRRNSVCLYGGCLFPDLAEHHLSVLSRLQGSGATLEAFWSMSVWLGCGSTI